MTMPSFALKLSLAGQIMGIPMMVLIDKSSPNAFFNDTSCPYLVQNDRWYSMMTISCVLDCNIGVLVLSDVTILDKLIGVNFLLVVIMDLSK